jgi:hypothetical protein
MGRKWLEWAVPEYEKFTKKHPGEVPNAARLKDLGHYELGNIEIVTRTKNCEDTRSYKLQPNGKKKCSTCKRSKPIAAFSKNKNNWDGLSYNCKICVSKYQRGRTAMHRSFKS